MINKEKDMMVLVRVDKETYKKAKLKGLSEDKSFTALLAEWIELYVKRSDLEDIFSVD